MNMLNNVEITSATRDRVYVTGYMNARQGWASGSTLSQAVRTLQRNLVQATNFDEWSVEDYNRSNRGYRYTD